MRSSSATAPHFERARMAERHGTMARWHDGCGRDMMAAEASETRHGCILYDVVLCPYNSGKQNFESRVSAHRSLVLDATNSIGVGEGPVRRPDGQGLRRLRPHFGQVHVRPEGPMGALYHQLRQGQGDLHQGQGNTSSATPPPQPQYDTE